jgi:hypothetical protein
MQSVFKMHIALAALSEVDKGNISLKEQVAVREAELLPDLWSPLRCHDARNIVANFMTGKQRHF